MREGGREGGGGDIVVSIQMKRSRNRDVNNRTREEGESVCEIE